MPSVVLHVVEFTFSCGFDSFRAHHVSITYTGFRAVQREAHNLAVGFHHVSRRRISVDIHRCTDVCMTHEALLDTDRRYRFLPG
jgi:hypothetical protein